MVHCPKCGKELKHKGALNGHLAFSHGVTTPKGQTMDELRRECKSLNKRVNDLETRNLSKEKCENCANFTAKATTKQAFSCSLNEDVAIKHLAKPVRALTSKR